MDESNDNTSHVNENDDNTSHVDKNNNDVNHDVDENDAYKDMEDENNVNGDMDDNQDDDNVLFGSAEKTKDVTLHLMIQLMKGEFGVDAAKKLIVDTANIPLYAQRDTTIKIKVDANDMRAKIEEK